MNKQAQKNPYMTNGLGKIGAVNNGAKDPKSSIIKSRGGRDLRGGK